MSSVSKRLSWLMLCSIMLFTVFFVGDINAQLVTNGDFENSNLGVVTGNDIEGWVIQVDAAVDPAPDFEIVGDVVQHGSHALEVIVNDLGSNAWDIQVIADSIPVEPGDTYRYSVWVKSQNPGARLDITVGNYAFTEYPNGTIRPANLTTEWQEFTMEFVINDNSTFIRGPIHFNFSGNIGNAIYIDNMEIHNAEDDLIALKPLIVEAESGTTGSDFEILEDGEINFVSILTNTINTGNPGVLSRVNTYEVTFPDTGTYNLFTRVRVGSNQFDDDSFFYGNGFGTKDTINDNDWITVNGIQTAGFQDSGDVVLEAGGLGNGMWKWVNLSQNTYQGEVGITFIIEEGSLTKTFQIGGREDGLDIDKFAFGRADLYFTVHNLDNEEVGSTEIDTVEVWQGPPLASGQSKFVGNIYSSSQEDNFESYWNQVTPENAGKWGSVEGTRDQMNWTTLDAAYNLAKDNGFPFNFHVLIWGAQQPNWISELASNPTEQLEEIQEWFQAVADRYTDIEYLQVVNEPLPGHNPPDGGGSPPRANYKEALGGDGETGWDWVLNAFRMAREIFPATTKLMINDFNIISSSTATSQYVNLIRLLQQENLVDIIGEQGHAFTTTSAVTTMRRNLDTLATTGLPIQITEMDIDGPSNEIQLQGYKRIFPTLFEHPAVEGITLWGWRQGLWRESAYLIENNGAERPALQWLRDYLDTVLLSVEYDNIIVKDFQLLNNFPNPFNPTTKIRYNIPQTSEVTLKIYDILGREVQTLINGSQSPGEYTVTFDAQNLSSGVYFYRLTAGSFVQAKQMLLMK